MTADQFIFYTSLFFIFMAVTWTIKSVLSEGNLRSFFNICFMACLLVLKAIWFVVFWCTIGAIGAFIYRKATGQSVWNSINEERPVRQMGAAPKL